jgi:hypothetical protein
LSPSGDPLTGRGPASVRVFVSSTWLDLQPEREAVETALARLRETKFVGMEHFGSREETPFDVSLAEVDASDLYLGIVAGRYGSGITEAEYRRARERSLHCLLYRKQSPAWSEDDPAKATRLEAFLAEIGQHTVSGFTTPDDLAARATADLHRWLFDEILVPRLEEALTGKRKRREAEEILAAVCNPEELGEGLVARLRQAGFALSMGPRSIAVGGAVMRSIFITGDHNHVFVGPFETLADSYLEPWSVFERLRLDRFTGRDWLTTEVDTFLDSHDRGCFILEADAGLGKSAFLAHLVRERGWIHHFVERAPGQDGIGPGLRSLAAQIALAWRLEPYTSQRLLPAAAARPDFLQSLLFEAARRRDEVSPGEKIIVAVDALDESAAPPGQNVLGLPRVLPQGVYLVVSQRPVEVALATEPPPQVCRFKAADLDNVEDMRRFLKRTVDLEAVASLLAESGIAPDDFVATLLDRSGGVWVYLRYVLAEIERGERRPLEIEKLPRGLWQYYAEHWSRRRAGPDWNELELPLLATLAAIQEEMPARLLCAFAGVPETPQVGRLLREAWSPFLAVSDAGERRYRCYHASFREFLNGGADRSGLTATQQALADELAAATRAAHSRIADRALAAWGGLEGRLEGLINPTLRALDDRYSLRHLVAHLDEAGRLADLARLLRLSWEREGQQENVWHAVHEEERDLTGYVGDVVRVFRAAHRASRVAIERGEPALPILLELDCAYWIGSVRSLAGEVPPAFLAALVERGVWRKEHALAYAHQVPKTRQRFLALVHLLPLLSEPARSEALGEAVAAWHRLSFRGRKETLASLPANLPQDLLHEILRQELASEAWEQEGILPLLALRMPEDLLSETLSSISRAEPSPGRTRLLGALAPLATPEMRTELLRIVVEAAEPLFETDRMEILLSIAPFLARGERERIIRYALERARSDEYRKRGTLLLARTIPALEGKEQESLAREALEAALKLSGYELRDILPELISRLPRPVLEIAGKRILGSAKFRWDLEDYLPAFASYLSGRPERSGAVFSRVERSYSRGKALAALAPLLPEPLIERALSSALEVDNSEDRLAALDGLAPRLSRRQLERARGHIYERSKFDNLEVRGWSAPIIRLAALGRVEESLNEARRLRWSAGQTLADIVRVLQPQDLPRAQAIALKFRDPENRAAALAGIAAVTSESERSRLLTEAARLSRKSKRRGMRQVDLLVATSLPLDEPARQHALQGVLREIRSQADSWVASKLSEMILSVVPFLSEPLLREALALVDIFKNEDDARPILVEMVSRLPETLATEAFLLAPHKWCLQDLPPAPPLKGMALLCGRLWGLVPDFFVPVAAALVRSFAACLPAKTSRARLLMANAFEEGGITTDIWPDAMAAARRIPSPLARAAALTILTERTRDGSTAYWALAAALAIPDPASRADALDQLASHLSSYLGARLRRTADSLRQRSLGELNATEAIEILRESASTTAVRELLDRLPEREGEPLLRKSREIADEVKEPILRAWVLLTLVPYLPVSEGVALIQPCLREIRATAVGPLVVSGWARRQTPFAEPIARALFEAPLNVLSSLLVAAASHLPLAVLPDALEKVWIIDDQEQRARALQALAPRLASLSAVDLHPLWQNALSRSAGRGRPEVLMVLKAFLPIVEKLGGPQALEVLVGWSPETAPSMYSRDSQAA